MRYNAHMAKTAGTVCFIAKNNKVLLAEIEYPDGRRLWNGIGGVIEKGETPTQAVIREIGEETKLIVSERDIQEKITINTNSLELHVLVARDWSGTLETADPTLKQLKWFSFDTVPYHQMHPGNEEWLPAILQHEIP